jgi:hypothetical protein
VCDELFDLAKCIYARRRDGLDPLTRQGIDLLWINDSDVAAQIAIENAAEANDLTFDERAVIARLDSRLIAA